MMPVPALLTSDRLPAVGDDALPTHLWDSLSTESRQRVVHLMAQLACTLATTPAALAPTESAHVQPTYHGQNPA